MLRSFGNSRVSEVDSRVDEVGPVDGPAPPAGLGVEVPRADRGDAHREGLGHEMPRAPAQHDWISERRVSTFRQFDSPAFCNMMVQLYHSLHKIQNVSGLLDIVVNPNAIALYQLDYLYEPVDGIFVVVAEDGEVAFVEVTAEPAAAAHRCEGGDGAGVVHGAGEPLDGHGHGAAPLGCLESKAEKTMS